RSRRRSPLPRAARSEHRPRDRVEPLHRLCGDRRHRQGRREDRAVDTRSRPRAQSRARRATRRHPVGRTDDISRHPGPAQGAREAARKIPRQGARQAMSRLLVLSAAVIIGVTAVSAQHTRLFSPTKLAELEGPDREAWQRPDRIMDELAIGERSVVADLGAGGGWFTVHLAARVGPNGRVYAEDIQQEMLQAITRRVQRLRFGNVVTRLGTAVDPRLPKGSLDAALIVDAYNEIEQPVTLLDRKSVV